MLASRTRLAKPFFDLPEEKSCIVSVRNPVRIDDYMNCNPDVRLPKYIPNTTRPGNPAPKDALLLMGSCGRVTGIRPGEEKLPAYGRAGVDCKHSTN